MTSLSQYVMMWWWFRTCLVCHNMSWGVSSCDLSVTIHPDDSGLVTCLSQYIIMIQDLSCLSQYAMMSQDSTCDLSVTICHELVFTTDSSVTLYHLDTGLDLWLFCHDKYVTRRLRLEPCPMKALHVMMTGTVTYLSKYVMRHNLWLVCHNI